MAAISAPVAEAQTFWVGEPPGRLLSILRC